MPTFREPCSSLHQSEKQSDEMDCKVHEKLAFHAWMNTEETPETQNLYIN